ncbi:MAG: hypothetical protein RL095_4 [Verrucomicrobiota bacterium]|jgi:arylsulfatase A-like enzyme
MKNVTLYFAEQDGALALLESDWKYVELDDGTPLLYDLEQDPGEQHNLARELPHRVAFFAAKLAAWRHESGRQAVPCHA